MNGLKLSKENVALTLRIERHCWVEIETPRSRIQAVVPWRGQLEIGVYSIRHPFTPRGYTGPSKLGRRVPVGHRNCEFHMTNPILALNSWFPHTYQCTRDSYRRPHNTIIRPIQGSTVIIIFNFILYGAYI